MTKPEPSELDLSRPRGCRLMPWFLKNCSNMSSNGVPLGRSRRGVRALVFDRLGRGNVDDRLGDAVDEIGEAGRPRLREWPGRRRKRERRAARRGERAPMRTPPSTKPRAIGRRDVDAPCIGSSWTVGTTRIGVASPGADTSCRWMRRLTNRSMSQRGRHGARRRRAVTPRSVVACLAAPPPPCACASNSVKPAISKPSIAKTSADRGAEIAHYLRLRFRRGVAAVGASGGGVGVVK